VISGMLYPQQAAFFDHLQGMIDALP